MRLNKGFSARHPPVPDIGVGGCASREDRLSPRCRSARMRPTLLYLVSASVGAHRERIGFHRVAAPRGCDPPYFTWCRHRWVRIARGSAFTAFPLRADATHPVLLNKGFSARHPPVSDIGVGGCASREDRLSPRCRSARMRPTLLYSPLLGRTPL